MLMRLRFLSPFALMTQSLADQLASTALSGTNAGYIEDLYEQYLKDPSAVDARWAEYFRQFASSGTETAHGPIRELLFLNKKTGWAAGGNIYSGVGGIYFSNDGGNTWSLDVNTGAEMDACAEKTVKPGYQVWCAGYDDSFNGYIYTTHVN